MNVQRSNGDTQRVGPSVRELLTVLFGAAVLWTACNFGLLDRVDHWCYDRVERFVQLPVSERLEQDPVLLVYADAAASYQDPQRLQQIIDELLRLDPANIGLTFPVDEFQLKPSDQVVTPSDTIDVTLRVGTGGVGRRHYVRSDGRLSLEGALASRMHVESLESLEDTASDASGYRVWFGGHGESMPQVLDTELLEGSLIADMVAGKSVLIGWKPQPGDPQVATQNAGGMNALEFRGHALNSLLTNRVVKTATPSILYLCIVLAALLGFVCSRYFWRRLPTIAVVAIVLAGGVGWVFLSMRQTWIPVAPLTAAFFLSAWWVASRRAFLIEGQSERMASQSGQSGSDRSDDFRVGFGWSDAAALLDSVIDVDRLALLVARPKNQLEVVHLHACEPEDVGHQRLSLSQQPFKAAFESGDATRLDDEQFFVPKEGESQIMLPLFQLGQLMGVVVVGLPQQRAHSEPGLMARLSQAGAGLSRLVAHEMDELDGETGGREVGSVAIADFDLSGELRSVNGPMLRGLQRCGAGLEAPELISLLSKLLDTTKDDARQIVADVIFNETGAVLPTSIGAIGATEFSGGMEFEIRVLPVKSHASKTTVDTVRLQVDGWDSPSVTLAEPKVDAVDVADVVGAGAGGEGSR